ncbi:hypothetical protein CK203_090988 [Vitis vinifera]|uniref:Uncharacterized protein n=1 Tax=Vitis vinifera TaxID=29760 RepID=A0A438CM32_VITVI|nr:hypothetical protein CK203_090988 [Vitis vinifera]
MSEFCSSTIRSSIKLVVLHQGHGFGCVIFPTQKYWILNKLSGDFLAKLFWHDIDAGYICSSQSMIELHDNGDMKEVLNLLTVSELREISSAVMKVCIFF